MTEDQKELRKLLEKIYCERGFDFREYKESTLIRRLNRRLRAQCVLTYADYARVLERDLTEYDKLFDELTINVTSFFRDEVAFKALEETVLPALINNKRNIQKEFRVWSAGCATGQEPYSIAVLLLEQLEGDIGQNITILATDIDTKALDNARQGDFAPKEAEDIRPAWLDRYFVSKKKGFRVQPALRRLVTFETHNLVSDPPYYNLDLVACRNVLIYFTPTLQTRVLKGFYEGLKTGGFLLLGKSEVLVGETQRLFHCVDSKAKLYRKVSSSKLIPILLDNHA